MSRFRSVAAAVAGTACGVLLLAAPAPAKKTTVVCGQVITTDIQVANDLTNCPGSGLVVGAPGITIDLGNHTIDGDGSGADAGIDNTAGHDGVTVLRGAVREFNIGLAFVDSDDADIEQINADDNAGGVLLNGARITVSHTSASDNASVGLSAVNAPDLRIDHGDFNRNRTNGGVVLTNVDRGVVTHVEADDNDTSGLTLQAGSDDVVVDYVRAH